MILFGWWHNAHAQQAGLDQYYYTGTYRNFTFAPVAYYQTETKWYAEGRFNYEALNTLSLYAGKTFERKATFSYTASPIAGVVFGRINGGSAGINLECDYRNVYLNTQSQYTFSVQQRSNSFIYSWSDLTYKFSKNFAAGLSVQQTKIYQLNGAFEKGFLLKAAYKNWSFPLYIFRPGSSERYFVLGLNYEWQKNGSKNSINPVN